MTMERNGSFVERKDTTAKEKWLDPWSDAYHAHQRPLREATETKDYQKTLQALHEHLPEMIAIRDEVATLPLPQVRSGMFGMLGTRSQS